MLGRFFFCLRESNTVSKGLVNRNGFFCCVSWMVFRGRESLFGGNQSVLWIESENSLLEGLCPIPANSSRRTCSSMSKGSAGAPPVTGHNLSAKQIDTKHIQVAAGVRLSAGAVLLLVVVDVFCGRYATKTQAHHDNERWDSGVTATKERQDG